MNEMPTPLPTITGEVLRRVREVLDDATGCYSCASPDDAALAQALIVGWTAALSARRVEVGDVLEPDRHPEPDRAVTLIDEDSDLWRFDAEREEWECRYVQFGEHLRAAGIWSSLTFHRFRVVVVPA